MPTSILDDKDFLDCLERVRFTFGIPGVALAVVDTTTDSPSVLTQGFGELSSGAVTGESVFCIASNTKLFVAVALGILVEEGKLTWDTKVRDLLPDLKFSREDAQETVTVADMLSHQTGLSGHLSFESFTKMKLSQIIKRVNHLRFTKAPREAYQYCNVTYALCGVIIERLSGQTFASFIRERILQPLGMRQTGWTHPASGLTPAKGSAGGKHADISFDSPALGYGEDCITAASGGMLSTAKDMGIWVSWLLRCISGKLGEDEPKIIGKKTLQEIITPRVMANQQLGAIKNDPGKALWDEASAPQYGFAQLLVEYRGIMTASHNGTLNGAGSILLWCPEKGFGVVILTNVMSTTFGAGPAIALSALDRRFGLPAVNWIERIRALPEHQDNRHKTASKVKVENCQTVKQEWKLSAKPAGGYFDPAYGKLYVTYPVGECANADPNAGFLDSFLREIFLAQRSGEDSDDKPDLIAVLEDLPFYDTYAELWHLGDGVFRAMDRCLYKSYDGTEQTLDMPINMIWPNYPYKYFVLRTNAEGKMEVERYSQLDGDPIPGQGIATFARRG